MAGDKDVINLVTSMEGKGVESLLSGTGGQRLLLALFLPFFLTAPAAWGSSERGTQGCSAASTLEKHREWA